MKRLLSGILMLAVVLAAGGAASAAGVDYVPSVGAPSGVLMEKLTGEVIYEKNAHARYMPASVTKLMTMLIIAEDIDSGALSPEDIVTASARAASFGGSCVFLAEGERMSVHEMLKCIAVVSANDCAVAMAEHISGSEEAFVARMNERARALGLENTHYTNCTGLFDDAAHYTTAYDVAMLSRELLRHEFIKDYTGIWMDSIRGGAFELTSTNRLVYAYPGCTGLKTGYTDSAKYCISATAEREGVEYIAVVMHAESVEARNADARAMLDYAFANYKLCPLWVEVAVPRVAVELGRAADVAAELSGAEYKLVARSLPAPEYELALPARAAAPIHCGDRLGTLTVRAGGTVVAHVPVLASEDVERLGLVGLFARLGGSLIGL